jgi:endonuclease-3
MSRKRKNNDSSDPKATGESVKICRTCPPPPFPFKKVKAACASPSSPFPDYARPTSAEVFLAVELLSALHGHPSRGEHTMPVLDSLVRTILSQNTTDKLSHRAFASLKQNMPTWREVYEAYGSGRVEAAIREGGLADIKAKNIHNILAYLLYEHEPAGRCPQGEPSYEWLREESSAFCKDELSKHSGVGPKTISCVLLFNMGRPDFPVDTHVLAITQALRWVPANANAEQAYAHLNALVPDEAKYALHVLLVEHGKRCPRCAKGGRLQLPQEGECPLTPARFGSAAKAGVGSPTPQQPQPDSKVLVRAAGCDVFTADMQAFAVKQDERQAEPRLASLKKESVLGEDDSLLASGSAQMRAAAHVHVKEEPRSPSPPRSKSPAPKRLLRHVDMQGQIPEPAK